jgi:hypothetical protein
MAIDYTVTQDGDTLLVHAKGFDGSLEEVQAYGMAIIKACLAHGVTHVLCNESELEYRLNTLDTYEVAEFIAQQVPALTKAAIVCHPRFIAAVSFWEDVAVNRGLRVRAFTDVVAARDWLNDVDPLSTRKGPPVSDIEPDTRPVGVQITGTPDSPGW